MSESDSEVSSKEQQILDLFATAGYIGAGSSNATSSPADLLTQGLSRCITAANHNHNHNKNNNNNIALQQDNPKVLQGIITTLRSMRCPYSLQSHQIQDLDYNAILPVLQWLLTRVETDDRDEVSYIHEIEKEEDTVKLLEEELGEAKHSLKIMESDLNEQTVKKVHILKEMQYLQEKLDKNGHVKVVVDELVLLSEMLKELEKKESDIRSSFKQVHSNLQADVLSLEEEASRFTEGKISLDDFSHFSPDPLQKLNSAKSNLAVKLREVLSLKRQLDDVPCQSELIQYERRFSELYAQIQEKHRQTSKYYATYNALLEIKELVLKETSLLNSVISQFQDAINNPAGRTKLINSMEGIAKGTQQKLDKVQFRLQNEQKLLESVKEKYSGLIADQRQFSSLLKTFQEEYTKNEKLRKQISP